MCDLKKKKKNVFQYLTLRNVFSFFSFQISTSAIHMDVSMFHGCMMLQWSLRQLSNARTHTHTRWTEGKWANLYSVYLRKPQTYQTGPPLCSFLPVVLFIQSLSSEGPGSQNTHTHQLYTDEHQCIHKYTLLAQIFFFPLSLPHPLSICGVFKHQSRVV